MKSIVTIVKTNGLNRLVYNELIERIFSEFDYYKERIDLLKK